MWVVCPGVILSCFKLFFGVTYFEGVGYVVGVVI